MTAPTFTDSPATHTRRRLLLIACGKDDKALQRNEALARSLQTAGIRHE